MPAYAATVCSGSLRWMGVADWLVSFSSFVARCEIARRTPYLTPLNHMASFDLPFLSTHYNLMSAEPGASNLPFASCITAPQHRPLREEAPRVPRRGTLVAVGEETRKAFINPTAAKNIRTQVPPPKSLELLVLLQELVEEPHRVPL